MLAQMLRYLNVARCSLRGGRLQDHFPTTFTGSLVLPLKCILLAVMAIALASPNSCAAFATNDSAGVAPQLVVRAGVAPNGMPGSVVLSPNGRFVALQAAEKLIVFDLKWNTEIRRIQLKSSVRHIVFPSHLSSIFVEDGSTLSDCTLYRQQPCNVLADDVAEGSAFAIIENDRWLAYLNKIGIPELVDIRTPHIRAPLARRTQAQRIRPRMDFRGL